MALKPVIYKISLNISDLDRHYYDTHDFTLALHPSETHQRLVARIIAFCINAHPELTFSKGLSTIEEPDLWQKSLDDQVITWIEVGEPAEDRVKKACRQAKEVRIYSFNSKTDIWWSQNKSKLSLLPAQYFKIDSEGVNTLAAHLNRTMKWYVTLSENTLSFNTEEGECDIQWQPLG